MKLRQILIVTLMFGFVLACSSSVMAQRASMSDLAGEYGPFKPTWNDLTMLPDYCRARVVPHLSEAKRWAVALGPTWAHIHHYCQALKYINEIRYSAVLMNDAQLTHLWMQVIAEIDYVIRNADRRFPLMPEMMANRQMAEAELMVRGLIK